ncbi:O-antigen ligase family protein [Vibrio sp. SCSIO 43136]|uniref:O-antigen ligase family protein n=1 Tax=Vibrio sp. SCSIO 43136 TaxID=2819101 RepID=UPI002075AF8F|nr:O-antigen ligase family protein [Vibrio sp. SCSIO 43136]USD67749.1 hypothetical protein J4N39_16305 [Vibrio sp. SCSIO 43136]
MTRLNRVTTLALLTLCVCMLVANSLSEQIVAGYLQHFYLLGLLFVSCALGGWLANNKLRLFRLLALVNILLFFSVATMMWLAVMFDKPITIFTQLSFANPRFLNHLQAWVAIPVGYFAVVAIRRQRSVFVTRLALVILFATAFATDARGALLSIVCGFFIMAIADKANRKLWFQLLWQCAVVGYAFKYCLIDPLPKLLLSSSSDFLPQVRTTSSSRITNWLEILHNTRWYGWGSDQYACDGGQFAGTHNSFLTVLYQWGVVALLAYLALIGVLVKALFSTPHRVTRVLAGALVTAVIYSFFTGLMITPLSQMIGALVLGTFWSLRIQGKTKVNMGSISPKKNALIVALMIGVIGAVSYRVALRIENYPMVEPDYSHRPQFWVGYNCLTQPQQP